MAKLVTKFKYLKPGKKKKGGYARYIATREGVGFKKLLQTTRR